MVSATPPPGTRRRIPAPHGGMVRAATTLGVGLVVLEGAALLVGLLVIGHHGGGPIQRADNSVQAWWIEHRRQLEGMSRWIGYLSNPVELVSITFGVSLLYIATTRKVVALAPLFALAGGEIVTVVTSHIIDRPRPATANYPAPGALKGVHAVGSSFPSDHTITAVALVVSIAGVASVAWRLWSPWALGGLVGLCVASTTMIIGVEWMSDVAFGAALGLAWGITVTVALRRVSLPVWPFNRRVAQFAPPGTGVNAWRGNRAAGWVGEEVISWPEHPRDPQGTDPPVRDADSADGTRHLHA